LPPDESYHRRRQNDTIYIKPGNYGSDSPRITRASAWLTGSILESAHRRPVKMKFLND